jgi:hypothetical protein
LEWEIATMKADLSAGVIRGIYDGQERLGSIEQCGKTFIAVDRLGHSIGVFDSAIEAANAVTDKATRRTP